MQFFQQTYDNINKLYIYSMILDIISDMEYNCSSGILSHQFHFQKISVVLS